MYKKVILLIILLLISGCTTKNVNKSTLEDNVNYSIKEKIQLNNVYNKGYKYYMPKGMKTLLDEEYNQVLISEGTKLYLYVDIVSYYNKKEMDYKNVSNIYKFMTLNNEDNTGYIKIFNYNDKFLVEMLYNYGIIEMIVDETNLKKQVINCAYILSSIKYNDKIIEKLIGEGLFESKENIYEIFRPTEEEKNILNYVKDNYEFDKNEGYE